MIHLGVISDNVVDIFEVDYFLQIGHEFPGVRLPDSID